MTNSKPEYNIEERAFEFVNKYTELKQNISERKKIFSTSIEKSNVVCSVFENLILGIICILRFGSCDLLPNFARIFSNKQ